MEKGINSQIILRCPLEKIFIWFSRKNKICQNGITLIKDNLIFGMFKHAMSTIFCSLILSADKVISLFLIIKKIIDNILFFDPSVETIGVKLDIFAEGLDIWIIATDYKSGMVIVLINFHKAFNFACAVLWNHSWLIDDPWKFTRRCLAFNLQFHGVVFDQFESAHVVGCFEGAFLSSISRDELYGDWIIL